MADGETDSTRSSRTTKTLSSTADYNLSITRNTAYYYVNDEIDDNLFNGSIVSLKVDGKAVTLDKSNIKITVKNSSGDTVQAINNSEPETYTVTYTVTYKDYTGSVSNKIVIKEKAQPTNTDEPESGN